MFRKFFPDIDLGSLVRILQEEYAGTIDRDTGRRHFHREDSHIRSGFVTLPYVETLYKDIKGENRDYRNLINVFKCSRVFPNRAVKRRRKKVADNFFQDQVIIGNDVLMYRVIHDLSNTYRCDCYIHECYVRPFSEGANNITMARIADAFIEDIFTKTYFMSSYFDESSRLIKEVQLIIPEEHSEWDVPINYEFVRPILERLGYNNLRE